MHRAPLRTFPAPDVGGSANWANYGKIIKAFQAKYGITIDNANPDRSIQDEINAVKQLKGQDRAPDVLDLGQSFAIQASKDGLFSAAEHGPGIVTGKTFLGGTTRVAVLLDGDLAVLADRPSGEAAQLGVGDAVDVAVTGTQLLLVDPTAG